MTKLDDLLQKWPMRQTSQLEADEAADRFVSAVQAGQMPAEVDDSLLRAPLPKTAEEGNISKPGAISPGASVETKMSKDRTRDRTSFQELAKLASTTPPPPSASQSGPHVPPPSMSSGVVRGEEASSSDSGIVDLKMIATADPAAEQRAQTTPLAAEGLFDDEAAQKPGAQAPLSKPAPAPAAAPAVAQTSPTPAPEKKAAPVEKKDDKKGGGGIVVVLGSLVTAAAIAAGVFFYVKSRHAQPAPVAAVAKAADGEQKPATTKATTTTTAAATVAQADTAPDITNDTSVTTGGGKPSFRFHAKAGSGAAATTATAPDTTASAAVDPKLVANIPTGPAGGSGGDLNEAMKVAAGGGAGTGTGAGNQGGATNAPGNVPQRPSQGQVTGAIGNVMGAARACLGPDEPVSHATVTLQSDGTVKSVSISGFAAGKPQEACIKGALQKMTVSPFAEATYPVTFTIRPQ